MTPFLAAHLASAATPQPFGNLSGIFLTAGVVLLSVWIVGSVHRKIRRRRDEEATPREQIDRVKSGAAAREEVESYMADAEELTRRLAAHLDNKASRLEKLIAEADDRLRRLENAPGDEPVGRTSMPVATSRAPVPAGHADTPADPLTRKVYDLADRGYSAINIARELDEQTGKVELILALRGA